MPADTCQCGHPRSHHWHDRRQGGRREGDPKRIAEPGKCLTPGECRCSKFTPVEVLDAR